MTIVIHPEDLSEDAAFAVPVREALHSDPEIGLHLPKTEARILAALKALKIDDVHTNIGGGAVSGIVAILRGTKPGRILTLCLLRRKQEKTMQAGLQAACIPAAMIVIRPLFSLFSPICHVTGILPAL